MDSKYFAEYFAFDLSLVVLLAFSTYSCSTFFKVFPILFLRLPVVRSVMVRLGLTSANLVFCTSCRTSMTVIKVVVEGWQCACVMRYILEETVPTFTSLANNSQLFRRYIIATHRNNNSRIIISRYFTVISQFVTGFDRSTLELPMGSKWLVWDFLF